MSDKNHTPEIRKGLYGVVVDETAVSKVVPETNSLTYRGYPIAPSRKWPIYCGTASFPDRNRLSDFLPARRPCAT